MPSITPAKRVALALVAFVYIFASHGALAGGFLLQAVWILLGLGLARLLVVALLPTGLGQRMWRRPERKPEPTVAPSVRLNPTLDVAESL
jgi:hypothetical protein